MMNCNTGEITRDMAKALGWLEDGDPVIIVPEQKSILSDIPVVTPDTLEYPNEYEASLRGNISEALDAAREANNSRLDQLTGKRR